MKFQLHYPRRIHGQHYSPGIHTADDKLQSDWYFSALVKSKDVVILESSHAQENQSSNQPAPPATTPKLDEVSGQVDGEQNENQDEASGDSQDAPSIDEPVKAEVPVQPVPPPHVPNAPRNQQKNQRRGK